MKIMGDRPGTEVIIMLRYALGYWVDTYGQICVELIARIILALF